MEAENHFLDERSQGSLAAAATAPFWYSPNHQGNTIQTRGQQGSLRQVATSENSKNPLAECVWLEHCHSPRGHQGTLGNCPTPGIQHWPNKTRQPSEPRGHKGPLADETKKHLRSLMLKQRSQGTLEKARVISALRFDCSPSKKSKGEAIDQSLDNQEYPTPSNPLQRRKC